MKDKYYVDILLATLNEALFLMEYYEEDISLITDKQAADMWRDAEDMAAAHAKQYYIRVRIMLETQRGKK